jgi:hypothetical protein
MESTGTEYITIKERAFSKRVKVRHSGLVHIYKKRIKLLHTYYIPLFTKGNFNPKLCLKSSAKSPTHQKKIIQVKLI